MHLLGWHSLPVQAAGAELMDTWPSCIKECGIWLDDPHVIEVSQQLVEEESMLAIFCEHFDVDHFGSAGHSEGDTPAVQ